MIINEGRSGIRTETKSITFTGAANLGAVGTVPIFTITGSVLVTLSSKCTTDLVSAGGGTLALGVTGATTLFIGATTATTIDINEFWVSTTPTAAGLALPAAMKDIAIGANIIGTVATADITGGVIEFTCLWIPLGSGLVVPS